MQTFELTGLFRLCAVTFITHRGFALLLLSYVRMRLIPGTGTVRYRNDLTMRSEDSSPLGDRTF